MTQFEIEAFFVVVNAGSISKAAEMLSISQSALSRKIQLLEDELGYRLFSRNRGIKQTSLTAQGKAFAALAEQMLELYGEMIALRFHNERRVLRISAPDSLNSTILRNVYSSFLQKYPDIKLSISTNRSAESYQYMEEGRIDIAYVGIPRETKSIACNSFFTEKIVFVCAKNSKYMDYVKIDDLNISDCIFFRYGWDCSEWFQKHFIQSDSYYAYVDKLTLFDKSMFENDRWSLLPYHIAQELIKELDLDVKYLEDCPSDRHLYCVYRKNALNSDIANLFEAYTNRYLADHFRDLGVVSSDK